MLQPVLFLQRFCSYTLWSLLLMYMRIAFLGKGGSGKTTVSSLVARVAPETFNEIFVIDSDINMHMKGALGVDDANVSPFLPIFKSYEHHIRQTHPGLEGLTSLPRTLPVWTAASQIPIRLDQKPFDGSKSTNRTAVYELGGYSEKTMGWSCHHSSLGKLQLVLTHTKDTDDQLLIADLTAGADVFGVGMLGLFDVVYVVVEPTLKSTSIFKQLRELADIDDIKLTPIANKVIDQSDLDFIETQIGIRPHHAIELSNFVRRLERGEPVTTNDIEPSIKATVLAILEGISTMNRDAGRLYAASISSHQRAAKNWPKDKFGDVDLMTLINADYKV